MSTSTGLLTAEDLWNLPAEEGRFELVRGELRCMSPSGFDHGAVTINLSSPLAAHVKSQGLGVVVAAETGFILERDPDTVRAPDIGFVGKEKLSAANRPLKFWIGAPDLAVETMSPHDTVREVDEKPQEWLAAGTALVWVINPRQKIVTVYRADNSVHRLATGDLLSGEEVVPGFQFPVSEIFE
ncbi:MAG: Uma2 family endonuclease [Planctomycetales bacterium]